MTNTLIKDRNELEKIINRIKFISGVKRSGTKKFNDYFLNNVDENGFTQKLADADRGLEDDKVMRVYNIIIDFNILSYDIDKIANALPILNNNQVMKIILFLYDNKITDDAYNLNNDSEIARAENDTTIDYLNRERIKVEDAPSMDNNQYIKIAELINNDLKNIIYSANFNEDCKDEIKEYIQINLNDINDRQWFEDELINNQVELFGIINKYDKDANNYINSKIYDLAMKHMYIEDGKFKIK